MCSSPLLILNALLCTTIHWTAGATQTDKQTYLSPRLCSSLTFSLKTSLVLFAVSSYSSHSTDFSLYLLEFITYSFDCIYYPKWFLLVCLHGSLLLPWALSWRKRFSFCVSLSIYMTGAQDACWNSHRNLHYVTLIDGYMVLTGMFSVTGHLFFFEAAQSMFGTLQ